MELAKSSANTKPRARALIDVLLVLVAIGFGWLFSRHILYPALHVPDSAPVILRPILGFLMAWYLVRRQGERWSSYGLRRPDSMLAFVGWTALIVLLLWVSGTYLAPVLASVLSFEPRPDFFGYVHGNTLAFTGWVAISWLVGGFCEELLFRGFLLSQIRSMFRSPLVGMATGLTGQALVFGALHVYQGAFGIAFATITAVISGAVYLLNGRNLWPLIVAHGAWDSFGMYGLYR
jgi:uncharacterized protein